MPLKYYAESQGDPLSRSCPAIGVELEMFIPWTLVERGVKKEIITPIDAPEAFTVEAAEERQQKMAEQVAPVVRALGLAFYWQKLLEEGRFTSLTEIAKAEGVNRGYVSRVAGLTRLAPELVEQALKGRMTLDLAMRLGAVGCWEEQRNLFTRPRNQRIMRSQVAPLNNYNKRSEEMC